MNVQYPTRNSQCPSERLQRMVCHRTGHSPVARTWELDIPCWILGVQFRLSKRHSPLGDRLFFFDSLLEKRESHSPVSQSTTVEENESPALRQTVRAHADQDQCGRKARHERSYGAGSGRLFSGYGRDRAFHRIYGRRHDQPLAVFRCRAGERAG